MNESTLTVVQYFIFIKRKFTIIFSIAVEQCFSFPMRQNTQHVNMMWSLYLPGGLVGVFGGGGLAAGGGLGGDLLARKRGNHMKKTRDRKVGRYFTC